MLTSGILRFFCPDNAENQASAGKRNDPAVDAYARLLESKRVMPDQSGGIGRGHLSTRSAPLSRRTGQEGSTKSGTHADRQVQLPLAPGGKIPQQDHGYDPDAPEERRH